MMKNRAVSQGNLSRKILNKQLVKLTYNIFVLLGRQKPYLCAMFFLHVNSRNTFNNFENSTTKNSLGNLPNYDVVEICRKCNPV